MKACRIAIRMLSVVTILTLATTSSTFAAFTNTVSIAQGAVTSATLQPPSSLTATGGCQNLVIGPKVTLNWTATTSIFAMSYNISRSTANGGPYTFLATVAGQSTITYTDTTASGLNTTYYYVLQSEYLNWGSVNSNQAAGTTPLLCL